MKKCLLFFVSIVVMLSSLASCTMQDDEELTTKESVSSQTETQSTQAETQTQTSERDSETETETNLNSETQQGTDDDKLDEKKVVRSNTGNNIDLLVEYTTQKNTDGSCKVVAQVKLECYAISVTGRSNNNYLTIGDETCYFSTQAINYSGKTKSTFMLAEHVFILPEGTKTVPLVALWNFNGVYSEKPISTISIEQSISLD